MVKRLPERKLDRGAQTTDGYEVRFLTSYNGPVVQLVRISACHAEGHEFESRLDRNYKLNTN